MPNLLIEVIKQPNSNDDQDDIIPSSERRDAVASLRESKSPIK